jgi:adenine C2-methylase RlmN of 23S rRNA A2503 and tRNA A37
MYKAPQVKPKTSLTKPKQRTKTKSLKPLKPRLKTAPQRQLPNASLHSHISTPFSSLASQPPHFRTTNSASPPITTAKLTAKTTPRRHFATTPSKDESLFGTLPPAPDKSKEEEQIPDLPNYINTQYEGGRRPIMSMTLDELTTEIQQLGLPKFRAKQIYQWVYQRGASDWAEMRNLSKKDQDILEQNFFIYPIDLKYVATASDATKKYVFQVEKKGKKIDTIESVFIPRVWNRLYGLNDDEINDQVEDDIPLNQGGGGGGGDDNDDDIANTPYDVSTFLEYQNSYRAHLVKTGKLSHDQLTEGTDLNSLNIVSNSTIFDTSLGNSFDSLNKSNDSLQNDGQNSNELTKSMIFHKRSKNARLFIPDFLQSDPKSGKIHSFDKALYQYEKGAVCFSSQIGCTLACTFCHTGTIDKQNVRNLSTAEIIAQIMAIKQDLDDFKGRRPYLHGESNEPGTIVSSVVAMGQGEFGYNVNNVIRALKILNSPDGLNMGRRHITVSTSGVVNAMDRLGEQFPVNLAISLHAVTDELRDKMMPINKTFPLATLMDSVRRYPGIKKTRLVTFEYIMLAGINDSETDARELLRLIKGIPSLVNLIPFNSWPGAGMESSSSNRIRRFQEVINSTTFQTGIRCTVRSNRGNSDLAACGTLNSKLSGSILKHVNQSTPQDVNLTHLIKEATKL